VSPLAREFIREVRKREKGASGEGEEEATIFKRR
jgi:hypothetical protein